MKWIDTTLSWFFPRLLVAGTPWEAVWLAKEHQTFLLIARIIFPIMMIGELAHFLFYDKPMGLTPIDHWWQFRLTMATIGFVTFLFYVSPLAKRRWYKLPALIAFFSLCVSQALTYKWYGHEAWVFAFLWVIGTSIALRTSALKSLAYASVAICAQIVVYLDTALSTSDIVSGSIVSLSMVLVVRSSYLSDIRSFILDQEHVAAQRKIAELNSELATRVRAFIPQVIANRMETAIDRDRRSVLEASVDVLQAKSATSRMSFQ